MGSLKFLIYNPLIALFYNKHCIWEKVAITLNVLELCSLKSPENMEEKNRQKRVIFKCTGMTDRPILYNFVVIITHLKTYIHKLCKAYKWYFSSEYFKKISNLYEADQLCSYIVYTASFYCDLAEVEKHESGLMAIKLRWAHSLLSALVTLMKAIL